MKNLPLSSYNLAYLMILSAITSAYNNEDETITAFLPGNIGDRISFVLKTHGEDFSDLLDQESFIKYTGSWLESFYKSFREVAQDLRIGYIALEEQDVLSFYCPRKKAETLAEIFGNNALKDKIDHFIQLLSEAFWFDRDDLKLGV